MSDGSVKNRFFKAIYMVCFGFSAIIIILSIPTFIDGYKDITNSTYYFDRDPSNQALLCIAISTAIYGIGWGTRWIATGKTKIFSDL